MLKCGEEIVIQSHGNPAEQFSVDASFVEDFVNIGTVTA